MSQENNIKVLKALEHINAYLNNKLEEERRCIYRALLENLNQAVKSDLICNSSFYFRTNLNQLIALAEENPKDGLLKEIKKTGLYAFIYDTDYAKGTFNQTLNRLYKIAAFGIGIATLAVALFVTLGLLGVGGGWMIFATGLMMGGAAYLSSVFYGVINDIFATKSNLPYFSIGHQNGQDSIIKTNNRIANAFAWGNLATFVPGIAATILFAVTGWFVAGFAPAAATFFLPALLLLIPVIIFAADRFAKAHEKKLMQEGDPSLPELFDSNGLNRRFMLPTKKSKASWWANGARNGFGYIAMPIVGLAGIGAFIALSVTSNLLPTLLFTSAFSVLVPGLSLLVPIVVLGALAIYTYVHRKEQRVNRTKLDFSKASESNDEKPLFNYDALKVSGEPLPEVHYGSPIGVQKTDKELPCVERDVSPTM